jgi:MOSC domain-containing protein YiiM
VRDNIDGFVQRIDNIVGYVKFNVTLVSDSNPRNITREREFTIGGVRCRGQRRCEPCAYLQELVGKPILRPLTHRGGLRALILEDGEFGVGDAIALA